MSGITTKAVLKYAIMPGIIPRLRALCTSGFGYIAFLMAQIYATVRLLPANHAYLRPENIGRYGIRHVIAESANSLVLSKKNIDQIAIFILMLMAIVILALQLGSLVLALLFGPAFASSIFVTPGFNGNAPGTYDIAFMLLDQVFGVGDGTNNFFDSCVARNLNCDPDVGLVATGATFPWPFHLALQNMFRFYSMGILIIGTIIFLYFLMVVVVETAVTGTPFGQRFKNVWVPIRLVVAVGLLIPLANGYNSGQYIAFAAAKYGSGLATNGWRIYNETINSNMAGGTGNPLGEKDNLIAFPKSPDAAIISEMVSLLHACYFSHYIHGDNFVKGKAPSAQQAAKGRIQVDYPTTDAKIINNYLSNDYAVKPYLVKTPPGWQATIDPSEFMEVTQATTYTQALDFYTGGDIVIRFGRRGGFDIDGDGTTSTYEADLYQEHAGQVEPTCGEVRIPVTDKRATTAANIHNPSGGTPNAGYLGTVAVQRMYFELIRDFWHLPASNRNYIQFAGRMVLLSSNVSNSDDFGPCEMGCGNALLPSCTATIPAGVVGAGHKECEIRSPSAEWRQEAINDMQTEIDTRITQIWRDYNAGTNEFDMDVALLQYGWGGAGIWFNKLAQVNGAFISALMDVPTMTSYPVVMDHVSKQKSAKDKDPTGIEQFNPNTGGTNTPEVKFDGLGVVGARGIAIDLYNVFEYWNGGHKNMLSTDKTVTSGALETGMNLVFGTHGLFAMTSENTNIHPLAQLIALGKGLVESSIRNIAGSSLTAAMGGLAKAIDVQAGPLVDAASGFLMGTAFIGLTAGFVLFYVLPFLPFVYFFFAVASWIKTIFEAMVGVPLWALAHLRLDGDGLPGEAAANGYFLIFEIFIRPILSVMGLIAAMVIFTAQVRILNFIWNLVTENVGGHNGNNIIGVVGDINFRRSIVDEFFYTVLYAIIVYLMATSSFKLVDKIPDNILRWMGQGVSSFGDINQDPTENLTRYAALGGMTAGRQAAGGVKDLIGGTGSAVGGGLAGMFSKTPTPRSDRRLKENIEPLGFEKGIPVYAFSYIGEEQRYKGVMAQDVLKIKPQAVVVENGYLAVRYDLLGLEMEPLTDKGGER